MVVDNTLYTVYDGEISEIGFNEMGDKVFATVKNSWSVLPQSSLVFDGVVYQDVLGKAYLALLCPPDQPMPGMCHIKPIPELDGYRIIDAKHDSGVCMVVGRHKSGRYDKLVLRFDKRYDRYHTRVIEDVDQASINFITLANGLIISINDDGALELFTRDPASTKMKVIEDPDVDGSMVLCKDGMRAMFHRGKTLYSIKTR
jgi:hypothetical protein